MAIDKDLLRVALCEGVFKFPSKSENVESLNVFRITPEILSSVAALSDEEIQAKLDTYVADKTDRFTKAISSAKEYIADLQGQAETFSSKNASAKGSDLKNTPLGI